MVGHRVERVGVAPRGRGDGVRPGAHLLEEDAEAEREAGVGFSGRPGEPHAEVPRPQLLECASPRLGASATCDTGARHHGARTPVEQARPPAGAGAAACRVCSFGERLRLYIRSWCRCFRQRASALRHRPLGHRLGRPRSEARCRARDPRRHRRRRRRSRSGAGAASRALAWIRRIGSRRRSPSRGDDPRRPGDDRAAWCRGRSSSPARTDAWRSSARPSGSRSAGPTSPGTGPA